MANEIYQQILTNQNTEYRANQAQRESINNQLTKALSSLDKLANRVYDYTHDAIITDDLEKDYQNIITANPDLENVSAVGLLAILKPGTYTLVPTQPSDWAENYDKYFYLSDGTYLFNMEPEWDSTKEYYSYSGDVVRTQGNLLYINGETSDGYTFRGVNSDNGIEFVKIWYFQNGANQLTLQESFDYIIVSVNVHQIETVNINNSYLNYINTITINNGFNLSVSLLVKTVIDNYGIKSFVPYQTKLFYTSLSQFGNEGTDIHGPVSNLTNNHIVKTAYFPNLLKILRNAFWNTEILENVYCPKLKEIINIGSTPAYYTPFRNCPNLLFTIPESCERIVGNLVAAGIKGIVLKCKNAEIANEWCDNLTSIVTFEMCSDWGASINISKPAGLANWSMTKYIDLMTNKLRDMTITEETRTLTIPSAMLTSLQEDTEGQASLATAEAKGWTVGGA